MIKREYYADFEDCKNYVGDIYHVAIPWKEHFLTKLVNKTKLSINILVDGKQYVINEEEEIKVHIYESAKFLLIAKDGSGTEQKCYFIMQYGSMIARSISTSIIPVIRKGIVTIMNLEQYTSVMKDSKESENIKEICSLSQNTKQITVLNKTKYSIVVSSSKLQVKVEAECEEKITIPSSRESIVYVDTTENEVNVEFNKKIILVRVNGCSAKFNSKGEYSNQSTLVGPGKSEPYIRHLYISFDKEKRRLEVWCNTIDFRFE